MRSLAAGRRDACTLCLCLCLQPPNRPRARSSPLPRRKNNTWSCPTLPFRLTHTRTPRRQHVHHRLPHARTPARPRSSPSTAPRPHQPRPVSSSSTIRIMADVDMADAPPAKTKTSKAGASGEGEKKRFEVKKAGNTPAPSRGYRKCIC